MYDGTWQTRGWHSKNATFSIRNYMNGALLYYKHTCQKGKDVIVEGHLYILAPLNLQKDMPPVCHSKQPNRREWSLLFTGKMHGAVREEYPDAEIVFCGGHGGKAHKKYLEKGQVTQAEIERYEDKFQYQRCKCVIVDGVGASLRVLLQGHTQISPPF